MDKNILPFLSRIEAGEILVSDGAMGTFLFKNGLKPGDCPELMNLERPELLGQIANLYANAGSDMVQTNTFGGSPLKLAEYDLDNKCREINQAAVKIVREAIGNTILISGSCGPTGQILEPYGTGKPEEIKAAYLSQVDALVDAGVDVICIETMIDLNEAVLAVSAARKVDPEIPVMVTLTFDPTPNGYFTIMGNSIKEAVMRIQDAGADMVGSNCGNGLEKMIEIANDLKSESSLPIIIQSNAGIPEIEAGHIIYNETPEFFNARITRLLDTGVSVVGGCCGTTPDHIRVIRQAIDSR